MQDVLAAIFLLPLIGAALAWLMRDRQGMWFACGVAAADLVLAALVVGSHQPLSLKVPWMPTIGLNLELRLGMQNALLLLLSPLLTLLALLATHPRTERLNEYSGHLLLLLSALQGLFLADNLALFYIFFELMLLPVLVLTARWGGDAGRRASLKFLLYTLAGSLPMLLGIIILAAQSSTPDLSFRELTGLSPDLQRSLFVFFLLAFLVKVPLFPLHGWLIDLYSTAPAPVVAVVAGAMSKAGLYGIVRVLGGLFPEPFADHGPTTLAAVALFSLLYGGICALGAPTTRSILAFSSLSHLGLMVLAQVSGNQTALEASLLQMFSHGIATGGLFLVLAVLENRGMPVRLADLGGLAGPAPRLSALFLVLAMASLGCPGLAGFPGELMMLAGIWHVSPMQASLALISVVLAAWYLLRLYQGLMQGPAGLGLAPGGRVPFSDLTSSERWALSPLAVLSFWVGLAPGFWLQLARVLPWS